jgi:5-methyltetrahydrofolate--homocysteine methyltransferase
VTPFRSRLRSGPPIVADGAWGTMLLARGLPVGRAPETWTLEHPQIVADIAREYLDAGAEVLTTNTFGASAARLKQHGLEPSLDAINRRGVEILREVAQERAWISASIGPSGLLLAPIGTADPAEVADGFQRQIQALASAGADVLCIETMTDVVEAVLAVRAARAVAPALPIVATMTFDITRRGAFTVMGVSVERAAGALEEAGADLVGANCGTGIDAMVQVAREFARHTQLPISVRANAGLPHRRGTDVVYLETPDRFAAAVGDLMSAGVAIVGGCCGTTPAHIAAIAAALKKEGKGS